MQNLLTMEQTKQYFNVKDTRTINKFIRQGLRFFPVGSNDKRFDIKDIEEFIEIQKTLAQDSLKIVPIKRKAKSKTLNIDFQKRKINLEQNRVV